ncbi:MAG: MDR family MFS transporter [Candidatus Saccharimonadales bacterium]
MDSEKAAVGTVTANEPSFQNKERTHAEIMVIISALMLAMLLAALDQTIVATALPRIASDLHGLNKLSWVATAYLLTSAITTPLYGKIGDLYGRKKIFQISIIIFLAGSALCGFSQNMDQLVLFRALQGIGAGGLISLVLAIIGDVVPPRQRGRYQGYFGAVFGVASIAGPLLGGFLANEHTLLGVSGWRWIFYINVPLGILALIAIATRLHLPKFVTEHRIDYRGAALLSLSAGALIFVSVWAGITYAWSSWQILSLLIAGFVLAILFVINEFHAKEPIMPINLFKGSIFRVSVIMALFTGVVMFASILYIPEYQQIIRGYSPIKSGLMLFPMVFGIFTASIGSGRLITRWGHYRPFPIIGGFVLLLGLWLFSGLSLQTSQLTLSIWMVILGLGIGMFMQVPVLAVQNSAPYKQMGAGTSTVAFARSIGSSFGGAVFGTVLLTRLNSHLHVLLPQYKGRINASSIAGGTQGLSHIPLLIQHKIYQAFVLSFHDMFIYAIPVAAVTLVFAFMLKEVPLRETGKAYAEGEGFHLDGDL